MRILPDGLTGSIMAVEGISDACVLLHGPGGCRIRHMVHSSVAFPRRGDEEGVSKGPYFYGYGRIPATYLDEYDYINGAAYKLDEAMGIIGDMDPALLVVIDSPGAALIGDDHLHAAEASGLGDRVMLFSSETESKPLTESVGWMLRAVMEHLRPERSAVRRGTVNLLGLSTLDKDWRYARDELTSLLGSMGLEVIAAPGAGSSVEDLMASVDAEYNVVVCPEMCAGLLEWYESAGVQTIRSEGGAPVGFDAVESWIRAVADAAGADPAQALSKVEACREAVFSKLAGMRYNAARIRGMTFSIAGTASVVRPLTEWLYSFLSMVPETVAVDPGADRVESYKLRLFLESSDLGDSWGREPDGYVGAVLCEGVLAETMRLRGDCRVSIPIGYSSMGLDDIMPRPVYGLQGVLYILDEILHGARGS